MIALLVAERDALDDRTASVVGRALAAAMRFTVLPGRNWFELLGAAALIAAVYFSIAFFAVLDAPSRRQALGRVPGSARLLGNLVWP